LEVLPLKNKKRYPKERDGEAIRKKGTRKRAPVAKGGKGRQKKAIPDPEN